MWKIQAKIIFIVPLENDKKKSSSLSSPLFSSTTKFEDHSAIALLSGEKRWKILARWMEGGRGGQYRLDRCNFHVENRPACCNCSFDRWPRRESSKEGGSYDRRIDKNRPILSLIHDLSRPFKPFTSVLDR